MRAAASTQAFGRLSYEIAAILWDEEEDVALINLSFHLSVKLVLVALRR